MDEIIKVENVYKQFYFYKYGRLSLKNFLIEIFSRFGEKPSFFKGHYTLENISFSVKKGEVFGIIGRNGSGKSTLAKLIMGIYVPTLGKIEVKGSIFFLADIAAGFQNELTGLENVFLLCSLYGYRKKEIRDMLPDIISFSNLEEFMNIPVKYYSSGMIARLGFSISISVNPEILLIDEVFAVGDEDFKLKCVNKIKELKNRGTTIILISHNMNFVEALCDRVMWLEAGKIKDIGKTNKVVSEYLKIIRENKKKMISLLKEIDF